jgi:hypothetical protein
VAREGWRGWRGSCESEGFKEQLEGSIKIFLEKSQPLKQSGGEVRVDALL